MPIKTLHLTNAYHPTSGEVKTFYRALLTAAEERGRPLRLVVPGENYAEEEAGRYGRVYQISAPRRRAFPRLPRHFHARFAGPVCDRVSGIQYLPEFGRRARRRHQPASHSADDVHGGDGAHAADQHPEIARRGSSSPSFS
jgi:hypothetical protein